MSFRGIGFGTARINSIDTITIRLCVLTIHTRRARRLSASARIRTPPLRFQGLWLPSQRVHTGVVVRVSRAAVLVSTTVDIQSTIFLAPHAATAVSVAIDQAVVFNSDAKSFTATHGLATGTCTSTNEYRWILAYVMYRTKSTYDMCS